MQPVAPTVQQYPPYQDRSQFNQPSDYHTSSADHSFITLSKIMSVFFKMMALATFVFYLILESPVLISVGLTFTLIGIGFHLYADKNKTDSFWKFLCKSLINFFTTIRSTSPRLSALHTANAHVRVLSADARHRASSHSRHGRAQYSPPLLTPTSTGRSSSQAIHGRAISAAPHPKYASTSFEPLSALRPQNGSWVS